MLADKQLESLLRHFGLKVTETRMKVLNVLTQSKVALTHSDISSRIGDDQLDKVTLYRTLNTFVESGLAHKVATENRKWLYALLLNNSNHSHEANDHAHFICDVCDRIYCLPLAFSNCELAADRKNGFIIRSHEHRLHGICPDCQ